jgi:hypothetical protein
MKFTHSESEDAFAEKDFIWYKICAANAPPIKFTRPPFIYVELPAD